jgi:hypothetical protein
MKIAGVEEEITVVGEASLIDTTKADTSFQIDEEILDNAPILGRTIHEIVGYTPGVTNVRDNTQTGTGGGGTSYGQASFRGEGASGNDWLVDGLSIRGKDNEAGVRVNYDSWEEIQVISDGFSPDLGKSYGGIVNIITKSGGNDFHGELGAVIMNTGLRAERQEQLAIAIEPERSYDTYFGNLGGPIIKDKLWFFISDNAHRTTELMDSESIGWLSIPEGDRRVFTNNLFTKLTLGLSQNHNISLSGTLDKYLSQSGGFGVPERYQKRDYLDYAFRLNYKGIMGSNTVIEAAVGRSYRHSEYAPLSDDYDTPSFWFRDINQGTNNLGSSTIYDDNRWDFTGRLTQYLDVDNFGNHEIGAGFLYYNVFGGQIVDHTGKAYDLWPNNGFDDGVSLTWNSPGNPIAISEYDVQSYDNKSNGIGLYLKDKVTFGNITLMLGIRSETQILYNDLGEEIFSWGLDKFIAPRFSLAWDITGDGVNVFKLGAGSFKDTAIMEYSIFFNMKGGNRFRSYNWIGPSDPSDSELYNPNNWKFNFQQGSSSKPLLADPSIKPDPCYRVLVEYDRLLGVNWALKLRGIYQKHYNMLEGLALFDYEDFFYRLENFDAKRRDYKGIELEINGSVSDKLFLYASYVWSQAKGTNPGYGEAAQWGGGSSYNVVGVFGDHHSGPDDSPFAYLKNRTTGLGGKEWGDEGWYGFLPTSCDHVVKIITNYLAPYGITASTAFEYYSGYHWSIRTNIPAYTSDFGFAYGRGKEVAPAHTYIDLSLQKDFALFNKMTIGLRANIQNLLNSQKPLSYMNSETSVLFGQVYGRQSPRWFQFQVLMKF